MLGDDSATAVRQVDGLQLHAAAAEAAPEAAMCARTVWNPCKNQLVAGHLHQLIVLCNEFHFWKVRSLRRRKSSISATNAGSEAAPDSAPSDRAGSSS